MPERALARLHVPKRQGLPERQGPERAVSASDVLAPVQPVPAFTAPMYEALAAVAPDFVLPGATGIPPDSVVLLRVDRAAVAAFMCGLNHELARELVWRGVPVDRRATFFDTFWDTRGQPAARPDIKALADWRATDALAELGGPEHMVLAVRGELLRRYPRTRVTAVRADASGLAPADEGKPENTVEASFTGFLPPDLRFFGFALDPASLRSSTHNPGWFFALQEQATEARFSGQPRLQANDSAAELALRAFSPPVRLVVPTNVLLLP